VGPFRGVDDKMTGTTEHLQARGASMTRKLAYMHTVNSLVPLFTDLSHKLLPQDVEVFHIVDEMLLRVILAQGGLSPFVYRRVAEHAVAAEEAGARAIQITCSSISPCVDIARWMVRIPVLKIDEPVVDVAIRMGTHIGISATTATTLRPTADLVAMRAQSAGTPVQVEAILCQGAYAALLSGDAATHDHIVLEHLRGLMARSDVVILAQASMARILENLAPMEQKCPVLSSPRLAVERAARVLAGQGV